MGSISPLIAAPGYATLHAGGFYTLLSALVFISSLGIAWIVVFGTKSRVAQKPWSENVEMAEKQLRAVEASRGTGWLSRTLRRGTNKGEISRMRDVALEEEKMKDVVGKV